MGRRRTVPQHCGSAQRALQHDQVSARADHDYIFSYDARREAVSSGNLQLLAYLVEQGIDSWRPEELADTDADQYMPECLTIAGKQVRYCLLVVHSLT